MAEIARHIAALADAAEGNLLAPVEHCPGWTVADLIDHVREVHWFWGTIAAERLSEPPPADRRPPRPEPAELIEVFRAGALHLVEVLRAADPTDAVWTWAPWQQDIAFIQRHQVQEAAVHRWDAEHAAGRGVDLGLAGSVDSIEEFLTFSVSSPLDRPEDLTKIEQPLGGRLALRATDAEAGWTVRDAEDVPGTLRFERGVDPDVPVVPGTASDLLLWLYQRVDLAVSTGDAGLIERFRALCYLD